MPKQIDVSSFECDCGYQLHFAENTIREMMRATYRKRGGISEGDDRHAAIFHRGEFVAIFCPKAGVELPVKPEAPRPKRKRTRPAFTHKQGQVLAYIHLYTKLNRQPPAEIDIARHFAITPPSAHQMIVTLENNGLIQRTPGAARSITLLVDPKKLPELL
jgi:repressor LexA